MERIAWWLVIIGALNWLLVGLFQIDLVNQIALFLGVDTWLSRVVYTVVGLAAVYLLPQMFSMKGVSKKS